MIKIALIIIVLMTSQLVFANDSIYKKPVINIYLADESRRRTFLKLPNVKKAELVFRGNEWHGLTRGWRKFYQLQFNDTGTLKFFLYSVSMLTNTSIPKTRPLQNIFLLV